MAKAKIGRNGSFYVDSVPEELQFPLKRNPLLGHITLRVVESMNNANKCVRNIGLYTGYLHAIAMDQSRHIVSAQMAKHVQSELLVPHVQSQV